jgi:hypothetical protein
MDFRFVKIEMQRLVKKRLPKWEWDAGGSVVHSLPAFPDRCTYNLNLVKFIPRKP